MNTNKILAFAKENGYEDIEPLKPWKGYDVYEPIFDRDNTAFVGPPLIILVKGDIIRTSTTE